MARVLLVRHGEAAAAWGGHDADPGLSELGHAQAEAAASTLAAWKPEAILTSPMRRCRETSQPFALRSGLSIAVTPAVTEIPSPADLPPDGRADWLRRAFEGDWAGIEGGDYTAWRATVAACVAGAGGAIVFTHFVAINAAVSAATGSERVVVFRPANASVTVLETDGRNLSLVELGRQAEGAVL